MTRIFQDDRGEFFELIDRAIEQIICIDGIDRHNTFTDIFLIWLKLKQEECWYRIFLDGGCCFASVYYSGEFAENYTEDLDNCQDCPVYQIDSRFALQGLTITSASVCSINLDGIKLEIVFDNRDRLILQAENLDSESNISIIKF